MNQSKSSPVLTNGGGGGSDTAALTTGLGSADFNLPFFHYLTIPKNTTQANYVSYNLDLPIGIIRKVTIEFPKGCSGLAGVQVFRGVTQVFPLPAGVWLRSDNSILQFAFTHEMLTDPMYLELRGYNEDDTYDHTVWLGFEMSGRTKDVPPQLLGLLNYLKG